MVVSRPPSTEVHVKKWFVGYVKQNSVPKGSFFLQVGNVSVIGMLRESVCGNVRLMMGLRDLDMRATLRSQYSLLCVSKSSKKNPSLENLINQRIMTESNT